MRDLYRAKLNHASWTWREGKFSRYHSRPKRKDRVMGRHDKRSARQAERAEFLKDL